MHKNHLFAFFLIMSGVLSMAQNTTDSVENLRFRIGSYGEILYQHMDYSPDRYTNPEGAPYQNRSTISIPRMILSFDYWFTNNISFSTEIEFEHGGTGAAMEMEYDEMGEYEMETEHGGEVVLEQFHLTKRFTDALQLRIGHMIVPVGMTNNRHLPIEFFGSTRPEGENELLPLTWHETGISLFGTYRKWNYEFQVVNGLDANGFSSANWIKGGHQGVFEGAKMTSPAFTGRIENNTIKNLRLAVSEYYGNSCKNTTEPEKMGNLKGTVSIITGEAEFNNGNLIARANMVYGSLSDSYAISAINKNISSNSQFARTSVASNAMTYAFEAGYNVLSWFHLREKLYPFIRYEYYNTMEDTEGGMLADKRFRRNVFTVGANYYVLPNLALKIDYAHRTIDSGNYNNENTVGVALVYSAWFLENKRKNY